MSAEARNSRLRCEVAGGELVVKIGVETLAFSAEHAPSNNPFQDDVDDEDDIGRFRQIARVIDADEFARDVLGELTREEEDGSSPIADALDKVAADAIENGSLGAEESGLRHHGDPPDGQWGG